MRARSGRRMPSEMKQISGRAVRTGVPLPPPAGPARDRMLWRDGRAAFLDSVRSYADSCRLLSESAGAVLSDIPTWAQTTGDLARRGVHETAAQQRHFAPNLGASGPPNVRGRLETIRRHGLGLAP